MNNEQYDEIVKKASPNSHIFSDCIRAFISGGLICTLGQLITNILGNYGFNRNDSGMYTSVILILIASILTGLGLYSKMGKFCGAGTIIPITGFSNSVTAPAIEFKKEGLVLGLGAKIFTVAGPVILYGTLTSIIVGIIYWFMGGKI